ncbi:MAG TPA: OmpA family protein, partial [Stellaceae bacterium]|nr:OmpA family protein [Stellaceae bacterium]
LIDVPVAVSAMNAEQIERYATNTLNDIAQQTPQVFIERAPSGAGAVLTIRGIGSSPLDSSIESAVQINLDGVPITRGRVLQEGFFDIDNVEILKGPQSLYFGKNSPAGVISLTSVSPGDELEGYARVGIEANSVEPFGEAGISAPLTDTFGIRVAMRYSNMLDGYIRNTAAPTTAATNPWGFASPGADGETTGPDDRHILGRFTAAWKPMKDFDATFKFFGSSYKDNGEGSSSGMFSCNALGKTLDTYAVLPNGLPLLAPGATFIDPSGTCKWDLTTDLGALPAKVQAGFPETNGPGYDVVNSYLASLTLNYRLDDVTFTSVTGYYEYESYTWSNYDFTTYALGDGQQDEFNRTWTEEIRAVTSFDGPLNFTGGFFYQNDQRHFTEHGNFIPLPQNPANGEFNGYNNEYVNPGDAYSPFIEGRWKIVPELELTGGARYTEEHKQGDLTTTYISPFFPPGIVLPPGNHVIANISDYNISPEATLTWHPQQNLMLYAAYKTGYQSGGVANPGILPAIATPKNQSFAPEKAKGEEIGLKSEFLNGRASFDLDAYHYDYSELQLTAFDATTTSYFTENAGSASIDGIEGNGNYRITPEFSVRGSFGYNRARYTSFPGDQCFVGQTVAEGCVGGTQNVSGKPLQRAPNWVWGVGASYDIPVFGDYNLGLTTDLRYTSAYYISATDSPYARQDSYYIFDASARLYNDSWEFAVIGKDLNNEIYSVLGVDKPLGARGDVYAVYARPQQIILQATYHFGGASAAPEVPPPAPPAAPPAPPPAPAVEAKRSFQVFFDFDKSNITQAAASVIQAAADAVKAGNVVQITVTGHTDTVGTAAYNQGLSERRAASVKTQLVTDGVAAGEITTIGVGKNGLLVPTADGVREPQNRRAEIVLQ